MQITGIAAEFNPLHNGHAALIAACPGDYCIIAMSGDFTQRGEPAMFDKFLRARMALSAGADAVFELPVHFAMAGAERFAQGMAAMLSSLGADGMLFGSESGDILSLEKTAGILLDEPESFTKALKEGLGDGLSFPAARIRALEAAGAGALPEKSNDILAIEYIKANGLLSLGLKMQTVKRPGAYNAEAIDSAAPSARAIRRAILSGDNESLRGAMPGEAYAMLQAAISSGERPVSAEDFAMPLLTLLRRANREELLSLPDVTEGLENRIIRAADAQSYGKFIALCSSRRYPATRISRIAFSLLLRVTASRCKRPPYARLLGFRRESAALLGEIKRRSDIPIISKAADYRPEGDARELWELDIRAADIYALATQNRRGGQDIRTSPIII